MHENISSISLLITSDKFLSFLLDLVKELCGAFGILIRVL